MTKEKLLEWGLTEEQASKVLAGLDGSFVPKARFNEVNAELKQVKETVKARDSQLEALQASAGDAEALRRQIAALQAENAAQEKAHDAALQAAKIDNAVEVALLAAKAKNAVAAKALLGDFIAKAELAEDGTVKGLQDAVKRLTEDKETAFLFDQAAKFKGAKSAEKSDGASGEMTMEGLHRLSPAERYHFSVNHPDEYKQLYGGNA